jgi:hypothetical protein
MVSWSLTAVFAATGMYSLYRLSGLGSGRGRNRVAELEHLLMSIAMIGMARAWTVLSGRLGEALQVVLFGLFALWFAGRLCAGGRVFDCAYHLALAGAMVWMVATMPALMGTLDGVMPEMPGMAHARVPAAAMASASPPGWMVVVTVAVVLLLAAAAVRWLAHGIRPTADLCAGGRADAAHHVLMCAGMGGMLLAVL